MKNGFCSPGAWCPVLLALGLAAAPAISFAAALQEESAGALAEQGLLPRVEQENGVSFLSGGVGVDERQQIKPLTRAMNLQLVFAEESGALLADVDVRVAESEGREVLNLEASDPLVFARLQPGTYDVAATVDGKTIERQVVVPAQGRRTEVFHWS